MKNMYFGAAALAAVSGPALAEGIAFKPLVDARVRYENVDQDGIARDADAVTARVRAGFELTHGPWSFLAESEATLAIDEQYNSGVNGKAAFPIVADPENVELNRLQVQFRGLPKTIVTVGRQRINLDDQRFVGSVGWRDNEQTFDSARIEWSGIKGLKADVTYAWSDRTIWGIDGGGARPQAVSGDNVLANLAWTTKAGTLSGFAYLVDQDELPVSILRMSSRTYGARFQGGVPLSNATKVTYAASYARQWDHHRNPNDYHADYWLAEVGIEHKAFKLGAGYEVLGAGKGPSAGVPLAAFQTPLATLHKFQGWADKFLTTPPGGVRDAYASASWGMKKAAGFDTITLQAVYHRFDSDRGSIDYGDEVDVALIAKRGKWAFTLKYADYQADEFASDTRKLWASAEWTF